MDQTPLAPSAARNPFCDCIGSYSNAQRRRSPIEMRLPLAVSNHGKSKNSRSNPTSIKVAWQAKSCLLGCALKTDFLHSFRIVVCVSVMPRSAIMMTKSLKLNLKLVYQLTHRMMICPSKCRPLNNASTGTNRCILSSSLDHDRFAPEPSDPGPAASHSRPLQRPRGLRGDG